MAAWNPEQIRDTIANMALGLFAMHVLEVMFFVGMAGSSVVVVISFVEDAYELFGED
jgi:hypothetical protein